MALAPGTLLLPVPPPVARTLPSAYTGCCSKTSAYTGCRRKTSAWSTPSTALVSCTSVRWEESSPMEWAERRFFNREGLLSTGILFPGFFGCNLGDSSVTTPPDPVMVLLARRSALLGAFSRRPSAFLLLCCGVISEEWAPSTSGFHLFPELQLSSFSVLLVLFLKMKSSIALCLICGR